jgi:hypothetical protein
MKYGPSKYEIGVLLSLQQYSVLYFQVSDEGENKEHRNVRKINYCNRTVDVMERETWTED